MLAADKASSEPPHSAVVRSLLDQHRAGMTRERVVVAEPTERSALQNR